MSETYHIIGLMSGSSLDGLDIAYCIFEKDNKGLWKYEIAAADCVEYDEELRNSLKNLSKGSVDQLAEFHVSLGRMFGEWVSVFMEEQGISEKVEVISSHGHTVLHQPGRGFTLQIGCGAAIAAGSGKKVVCDLRSSDVAYGGQGAPIVPLAEKYLFPDHKIFLNLGGIANISFHTDKKIMAFDVCGCNTLLNRIAQRKGATYDAGGEWARQGRRAEFLFNELNADPFCTLPPPKSLGTEYLEAHFLNKYDGLRSSADDMLHTTAEHIGLQIGKAFEFAGNEILQNGSMLITGGGARNTYLTETIAHYAPVTTEIPDAYTVEYKEALAIAFLGIQRLLEQPNCLSSVTGARYDSIGGAVYLPAQ